MSSYQPAEPTEGSRTSADRNSNYGTASGQSSDSSKQSGVQFPSCRLILYSMMFLGFLVSYAVRCCLGEAAVAALNRTAIELLRNASDGAVDDEDVGECRAEDEELIMNTETQEKLLGAYYTGYSLTMWLAGWLADRYGGRWLFGGSIALTALLSLLTPLTAGSDSTAALIALFVIVGLTQGFTFASIGPLLARWTPPAETTTAAVTVFSGHELAFFVGTLLSLSIGDLEFAGRWPTVFYVLGALCTAHSLAWFILCYNSPADHPRISAVEFNYLNGVVPIDPLAKRPSTPWCQIFISIRFWACGVAGVGQLWGYYTIVTAVPKFFNDVFGFAAARNGFLSALPYLVSFVTTILAGFLADWLRTPERWSTTTVRKLLLNGGVLLPALLMMLHAVTGCNRAASVAIVVLVSGCAGLGWSAVVANPLDLSAYHAGTVLGLTGTVALLSPMMYPLVTGALTEHEPTRGQWKKVFIIAFFMEAVATLFYVLFGTGELQTWKSDDDDDDEDPTGGEEQPTDDQ